MNKRIITLLAVFTIIASISVVSAGLLGSSDSNIDTHEFNYANRVTFNISDNLTDKTGAENILFSSGVSYKYPKGDVVCYISAEPDYGFDDVESNQNDALFEEIKSNPTSQGYKTYIFKWDGMDQYDVYIDLDNKTIKDSNGFEDHYKYFKGTFKTLDEAKVFVDTFNIKD